MVTFSFQLAEPSEINKIKTILKAFGVQKLKVVASKNDLNSTNFTIEAFKDKLEKSKTSNSNPLKSDKAIKNFIDEL